MKEEKKVKMEEGGIFSLVNGEHNRWESLRNRLRTPPTTLVFVTTELLAELPLLMDVSLEDIRIVNTGK